MQSAEKSDYASYAQALFSVSLKTTSSYYSTYRKNAVPRAGTAFFRKDYIVYFYWEFIARQKAGAAVFQLLLLFFMERFRYFEDFCLCFCVSPWQLHAFGQPPQVPPQECFPFLRSLRMDRTIAAMIATTMIPTMTLPIEMPPFETSGQFCL